MKTARRLLIGIPCGVLAGMPTLYFFNAILFAVGSVSVHSVSLKENLRPELLVIAGVLGALVAVPRRIAIGAVVGGVCLTLLTIAVSLPSWMGPRAFQVFAPIVLVMGLCGGVSFGAVVNAATSWAEVRVTAQGDKIRRFYSRQRRQSTRSGTEDERVYRLD
jgi:hypothetical protein